MGRRSPLWVEAGMHLSCTLQVPLVPFWALLPPSRCPSSNDKNSSHTPKTGRGSPEMVAGG